MNRSEGGGRSGWQHALINQRTPRHAGVRQGSTTTARSRQGIIIRAAKFQEPVFRNSHPVLHSTVAKEHCIAHDWGHVPARQTCFGTAE